MTHKRVPRLLVGLAAGSGRTAKAGLVTVDFPYDFKDGTSMSGTVDGVLQVGGQSVAQLTDLQAVNAGQLGSATTYLDHRRRPQLPEPVQVGSLRTSRDGLGVGYATRSTRSWVSAPMPFFYRDYLESRLCVGRKLQRLCRGWSRGSSPHHDPLNNETFWSSPYHACNCSCRNGLAHAHGNGQRGRLCGRHATKCRCPSKSWRPIRCRAVTMGLE
jgi:hypothetical protein